MLPPASNDDMLFGRFRFVRELDEGGSGVVFHVHDTRLRVDRALKLPRVEVLASESRRKRFREEAAKAASVEHDNVVRVYEADDLGVPYLVMEYCPDGSLKDLIEREGTGVPFEPERAVRIMVGVARGTGRIHAAGLLHRDLKPGNIMMVLSPGGKAVPKIADFGLARYLNADAARRADVSTITSENAGTIPYMSPEQLRAEPLTERSDIHALGAILYELLTGRRLFQGAATAELIGRIIDDDPPPPRNVPKALRTIVLKCLRKRPADRYASADELAWDLERFLNGDEDEIEARPEPVVDKARRWAVRRRSFLVWAGAAVPMFGLSGLSVQLAGNLSRERSRRRKLAERESIRREVESVESALGESKPFLAWERLSLLDAETDGAAGRDFAVRVMKRRVLDRIVPIRRHETPVEYAIHSPDRRLILAAETGGDVLVTDAGTLRPVARLVGTGGRPSGSRAVSVDGKSFALAYANPKAGEIELVVWDLGSLPPPTATSESRLLRLAPVWTSPAVGPDRVADLAFMDRDRSLAVVRCPGGGSRWTCEFHLTPLGSSNPGRFDGLGTLRPSPNGTRFAVGSAGALLLKNASDLKVVHSLPIESPVHASFSEDGRHLAAFGVDRVRVWSVEDGVLRDEFPFVVGPWSFNFASDGRILSILNTVSGTITLRDTFTGRVWSPWEIDGRERRHISLYFSPSGERFATYSETRVGDRPSASLWRTDTGERIEKTHLAENAGAVERCFSADGRWILASSRGIVARIHADPIEPPAPRRHTPEAWACVFSKDGTKLLTGGEKGDVRFWDAKTGVPLAGEFQAHPGTVSSLTFSPDGRTLLSTSLTKSSNLALWSTTGGKPLRRLDGIGDRVRCAVFSPDGRRIVTTSDDRVVRIWDANQGRIIHEIADFKDKLRSTAFSPDGRRLAVACEDGTVREYATGSWSPIGEPFVDKHEAGAVAYRPDGSELAAALVESLEDKTGRILIRSLEDPAREAREFNTDAGWIWCLAYSPDGDTIAVGGDSGIVQVLCAETGRQLLRFEGNSEVKGLAFAPDGSALAFCRFDGEVRIVRAEPGEP